MKISLISHNYLSAENYKKIEHISKRVEIRVISPDALLGPLNEYPVYGLPLVKSYKKIQFFSSQYLLLSRDFNFRKFKPDIIHVEYDPWNFIFIQTFIYRNLFRKRVPIICTVKQNTYTEYGILTKVKDIVAKYFISKVDHFLAVSHKTADLYKKRFNVDPRKITHIGALFGIDTSLFKPAGEKKYNLRDKLNLPKESFVIGYAGRFNEIKGVKTLLKSVKEARKISNVDLHLALMGDGELKKFLLKESKKKHWLHILPKGSRTEVAKFLKTLDLFIMPSHITKYHEEHDAIALLEAMSSGLPCIGTNSGIIPEILEKWGIIVKAGDSRELSYNILKLYHDKKLKIKLGKLNRKEVVNKYSLECITSKHYQIYEKIYDTKQQN